MNKWVTMLIGVLLGLIIAQVIISQLGDLLDTVNPLLVWGVSVFCCGVLGYDFGESGTIGAPM